jgi:tRNA (guanine-N7-)-methyltransferase
MGRNKIKKFDEMKNFPNVVEWGEKDAKENIGRIIKKYPYIVLELGCGKGEYVNHLASKDKEKLFLGIDIQGERIWHGAKFALDNGLENVFFLRAQIENILLFIPKKSVNEIWITFPDPFPKDRDFKKRLTSPMFIELYKVILKKDGIIHLKTDSDLLLEYTLQIVKQMKLKLLNKNTDIYSEEDMENINDIQTFFERQHLKERRKIKYIRIGL